MTLRHFIASQQQASGRIANSGRKGPLGAIDGRERAAILPLTSEAHPFFDSLTYPWSRDDARDFFDALALRFRTGALIDLWYNKSGAGLPALNLAQAPGSVWTDALDALAAFIIQHPGGARKRIGYARNQITSVSDQLVHYLTDTQPGSSGSPVLDEMGRLIALHHAGGRPQEVAGRPPLRKNEGIRIGPIADALTQSGVVFA